ncbi:hypothetical protein MesoLj113a_04590 [Mesorhizobium sp. 113-1-2]|nr:hypothetical protein MesoLj113a_04590 [Mesorhizobium sp. 113-1-2]
MVDAAAKAAQFSKDMSVSLGLRKRINPQPRENVKRPDFCFYAIPEGNPPRRNCRDINCAKGRSASVRAAQRAHDIGQADIGTENQCDRGNGSGKKRDVGF